MLETDEKPIVLFSTARKGGGLRVSQLFLNLLGSRMPVFLITLHAYRSWNADNPKGYVRRDGQGIHRRNDAVAIARDAVATQPAAVFERAKHGLILEAAREVATRRGWKLHAAAITPTHIHLLLSWSGYLDADIAAAKFKSIIGITLSKHAGVTGKRWFSRGQSAKRVKDRAHFDYLVTSYLPNHEHQGGAFRRWK